MNWLEKTAIAVRHSRALKQTEWLWDAVRPLYNRTVGLAGRDGLERVINGTDRLLISPQARGMSEVYEPEVWRSLMGEVRAGDRFADVGAFFGLYAIAVALRAGSGGKVWAFEPDSGNFALCRRHLELNNLAQQVELIHAAVGREPGRIYFTEGRGPESHIAAVAGDGAVEVACVMLDEVFAGQRLDLLKVDVEGYEELVLRGAEKLLCDRERAPRAIYLEVHPYAWGPLDATSESLLGFLSDCGYETYALDGASVGHISKYGEVVARKISG
jgi:FkbM family methyltransferase